MTSGILSGFLLLSDLSAILCTCRVFFEFQKLTPRVDGLAAGILPAGSKLLPAGKSQLTPACLQANLSYRQLACRQISANASLPAGKPQRAP